MGVCIAIGYLVVHCVFDLFFLVSWGFPAGFEPAWRSDRWWSDFINAVLIGYLPAALAFSKRGVARDLDLLRPSLRDTDAEFGAIRSAAVGPSDPTRLGLSALYSLLAAILIVSIDPSMSAGAERSLANPNFMWAFPRTAIFVWLVVLLIDADFNATRTYARLGRTKVKVDLLDMSTLGVFARRGQRSALIWVLFSSVFSLFWFGSASSANLPLLILALSMATAAFVVPLVGLRKNILEVKRVELDRLRDEIRRERALNLEAESTGGDPSPRLANLIAYFQLIKSAREWPVDAANLLRFLAYLLLGLGSWLGGALVERVLESALRSTGS